MQHDTAIINPYKGRADQRPGPFAVMIATEKDLTAVIRQFGASEKHCTPLMLSRLCRLGAPGRGGAVAGPMMGAPYAVAVLESLIALGARKIIFYGWCGAIIPEVEIGDILVPTGAFIDEGTSRHYQAEQDTPAKPSPGSLAFLESALRGAGLDYRTGKIWTTDAVFRETPSKVINYRNQGAVAVEMEVSALFSVARFREVDVAAVLVVSDELSALSWRRGFRKDAFRMACGNVQQMIVKMGLEWQKTQ